jgi:hypothetical protein
MSDGLRNLLGALVRGSAAGAVGTAGMTLWQELAARLQGSDGAEHNDEDPWAGARAPAAAPLSACRSRVYEAAQPL